MKTPQEIDNLKKSWLHDPCWDIETTEGFGDHEDELHDFRLEMERIWKEKRQERLRAKADKLGVPGNTALAEYVLDLEERVMKLESKIEANNGWLLQEIRKLIRESINEVARF